MSVLALIGTAAVAVGAYFLGLKVGARFMVEITQIMAQNAGQDERAALRSLDDAMAEYKQGRRP